MSSYTPSPIGTSPEYRLIKFLTGVTFMAGLFVAIVGLMIVAELKALSSSREAGFVEIKQELQEIRQNHSREVSEWTIWRNEVDRRLRELPAKAVERD